MTEVGVIPEEWEVKRIDELGKVVRGASPRPAGDSRYFNGQFIPWLTVAALTNIAEYTLEVTDTVGFLTEEGSKHSRFLSAGTLIIANSGATLGVAKILGIACCANDGIAAIVNQNSGDRRFICHYINTKTATLREVVATGNGQPNLNTGLIRGISLPYPPLFEQRAIASALSDVDALLDGLDRLISKKRDLKQAAMQQLLTGRTRLPGFKGEWESKRLGDICEIAMGRTPSRLNPYFWGEGYVWLSIADLKSKVVSNSKEQITDLAASAMTIIPKGTLLMSFKLSIGRLCFAGCDLFTNEAICSFNSPQANADFLYYALGRVDFSIYGKQAVKGYTLNMESLRMVEILLPSSCEQAAIAAVFSEMDAEIAALEARRDKTRALKQAMMQELFTGKTRLVRLEDVRGIAC